jgi:hypothetical protein
LKTAKKVNDVKKILKKKDYKYAVRLKVTELVQHLSPKNEALSSNCRIIKKWGKKNK